jgi:hypothetical protein
MNCDNPYSTSVLKTQNDIASAALYELLAIATKHRENLYVLRAILQAMEAIDTVKEACHIKEHRVNLTPIY